MKFNKILISFLIINFSFVITGQEKMISSKIDDIKNKTTYVIKRAINQITEDTEDPNVVFSRAIDEYTNEFSSYLNITALNVQDKEAINLPNYDTNYVAPEFYDVMYDYQTNLENSLTILQLEKYESLRMLDYEFDRYVTLNTIKFSTINPPLNMFMILNQLIQLFLLLQLIQFFQKLVVQ